MTALFFLTGNQGQLYFLVGPQAQGQHWAPCLRESHLMGEAGALTYTQDQGHRHKFEIG